MSSTSTTTEHPAFVVDCPLCDERLYVSPEPVTVPFVTNVIIDVWPPATIHTCKKESQ